MRMSVMLKMYISHPSLIGTQSTAASGHCILQTKKKIDFWPLKLLLRLFNFSSPSVLLTSRPPSAFSCSHSPTTHHSFPNTGKPDQGNAPL